MNTLKSHRSMRACSPGLPRRSVQLGDNLEPYRE